MTLRDRLISALRGERGDRLPLLDAGYARVAAWHGRGLPETVDTEEQVERYFGLDRGLHLCLLNGHASMAVAPAGALTTYLERYLGEATAEPSFFTPRQPEMIPAGTEGTLENLLAHRRADDPRRLDDNTLQARAVSLADEHAAIGTYLWGFAACQAALLAPELLADTVLLRRVNEHHLDFCTVLLDRIVAQAPVDFLLLEDDASPLAADTWQSLQEPYYRDILAHARGLGIEAVVLYSRADLTPPLADLHAAGVDAYFPGYPADLSSLRQTISTLTLVGGIDHRLLAAGREAIDQVLKLLKLLAAAGHLIPSLNAPVPEDTPLSAYHYYLERKWSLLIETDQRSSRFS